MGETRLQKLLEETSLDFQKANAENLERLAIMMSSNYMVDQCYKEILGRKDFNENCAKILTIVGFSEPVQFDINEMKELLSNNTDLEAINYRIFKRVDEFCDEQGTETIDGHELATCAILDDMNYTAKVEDETFHVKENLNDMLNEEIPKDFTKAQLKAINEATDSIDKSAEKYGEGCMTYMEIGTKEEYAEQYKETAYKEIADNIVFSSDNSPMQIETMSKILLQELSAKAPKNLEAPSTSSWIKSFCDIIKKHDMSEFLYGVMVSNRSYFELLCENSHCTLWDCFKDNVVDMVIKDPYESISNGEFDEKILTLSERVGLSQKDSQYVLKELKSDLETYSSDQITGIIRFHSFFDLIIEGVKPQDAFEILSCIDGSSIFDSIKLGHLTDLVSYGLSTDIVKECMKYNLDDLQSTELRMALMNGLSDKEIKLMVGRSAVEMCQIRIEIEQDRELHPNEHEVTKRIRRNNEIKKEESIENLPKIETNINEPEHKPNDMSIDD